MKKPPLPVLLISILFILSGTVGIIYHASELAMIKTHPEVMWVLTLRLLAIVGGIWSIKGATWARWVLVVWIAYHVGISFYHTTVEIVVHAIFMILVIVCLFNPKANNYYSPN